MSKARNLRKAEEEILGLGFFNAMLGGESFIEQMIDDLSGSEEWGQWWEPTNNSYQNCQITIRGDELEMASSEDIEQNHGRRLLRKHSEPGDSG